jgi:TfoX/Sxy family transcriptional regulator of competence genes
MAYDEWTAERIRALLSSYPRVVEKRMMGGLCFMIEGSMCCSVSGKEGHLIRVDPQAYDRTLQEPYVRPMKMGARTMKGFVRVDPDGYKTGSALKKWIERGLEAVAHQPRSKTATRRRRRGKAVHSSPRNRL